MPFQRRRFRIGFAGTHCAESAVALAIGLLVMLAVISLAAALAAARAKEQEGEATTIGQGRSPATVASYTYCRGDGRIQRVERG